MKVNAPEKIYLQEPTKVRTEKKYDNDIEYVHKDTFIEKVVEWLKESVTNNPECNRIMSKKGVITMGELIKDFRKYMKGE